VITLAPGDIPGASLNKTTVRGSDPKNLIVAAAPAGFAGVIYPASITTTVLRQLPESSNCRWPESRLPATAQWGPPVDEERLYRVIDVLEAVSRETGGTVPQIAIAWLLTRPTVSSVIIGARNEAQLRDNLAAADRSLTAEQIARLDAASATMPPYPYYPYRIQEGFARLNPAAV